MVEIALGVKLLLPTLHRPFCALFLNVLSTVAQAATNAISLQIPYEDFGMQKSVNFEFCWNTLLARHFILPSMHFAKAVHSACQVSAWQPTTLLWISCSKSVKHVPARVEESVNPVRQCSSGGVTNNTTFPKMP